MSLVAKMVARVGTPRKGSKLATLAKKRGVARTADFARIEELPRRVWDADAEELEELRQGLTEMLRPEQGDMFNPDLFILKAIQAAALREIHDQHGAFLPIQVGGGKAFISVLAAVVLEAERPILFVPADLREQTKRKVLPLMAEHFQLPPNLKIIGNSELSLEKNNDMLEKLQPDLIILDEAHEYKNKRAGRTKRMIRYMKAHPETVMVAMSGTMSKKSLKDYAHILQWCLGVDNAPIPQKWQELSDWADALDEGVPDQTRMAPGALEKFCNEGENARQGYARRLTETPGVIASGAEELGVSLRIRKLTPKMPAEPARMLMDLRNSWEDPNGDPIMEATELWRIGRQLALGFWSEWDPPAPRNWMDARREWGKYVRGTLNNNRRGLDTELQVWNECAHAEKPNPIWVQWRAIKDIFKPNPVARWVDTFIVDEVAEWLKDGPGIVWVEHIPVGKKLSEELGIPYFGAGKKAHREILDASGPIVASIQAHHKGKNLQHQWHRNLITAPPSSGDLWEQIIGRTHREGQKADVVDFDVLMHTDELESSFRRALSRAVYLEETLKGRQRLNYADITFEV